MKSLLVPQGCRSDKGLSDPVIKRLREHFEVMIPVLIPQNFGASYEYMEQAIRFKTPDLILITGDRVEMCAAAAAAFHNKVPIAHFYAGIINDQGCTFDDVDRHCITLWSDIQFCESEETAFTAWKLMTQAGLKPNPYVVGISHLDDLEVDECLKNPLPYDLVLINNAPLKELLPDLPLIPGRPVIQIGGNPDGDSPRIAGATCYDNIPRAQFMGLLKNCERFITNSSAAIYEAPLFLKPKQIVMVGNRNKNRTPCPRDIGASDRIVEILRRWLI